MIIADEEELKLLHKIWNEQWNIGMIEVPEAEKKVMFQIASTMRAKDYLALPLEEQRKWYLEWNPIIEIEEVPKVISPTKKRYRVPCGFRPWESCLGDPNAVY